MRKLRHRSFSSAIVLLIAILTMSSAPGQTTRVRNRQTAAVPMDANPLFLAAVKYGSGGINPAAVAVADVNGDGLPDLIVSNPCSNPTCPDGIVGVLLGNGDGTFQPAVGYDPGGPASSVAIADVNGDVHPDVIVANGHGVGVLLGNGNGTFQPAVTYGPGVGEPERVAIADLDGDGALDIVVSNGVAHGAVGVLLGNADGTFQPAVTYSSGGTSPGGIAVADVNGDGRPDIAVGNFFAAKGGIATVGVLLGNGDGTFQPVALYSAGGNQLFSVAVADLNGDGKLDIVAANCAPENLSSCLTRAKHGMVGVLLGNGDGTFRPTSIYDSGAPWATSVAVGDIDGDGKPDLLVTNFNSQSPGLISVLRGNGDGTFQTPITYPTGNSPRHVAVADINGDGRPDLIVANGGENTISVLLNNTGPHSPTTTTLSSSKNPVNAGEPVTYTATVTGEPGSKLTGTVSFQDGGTTVATTALSGNQATYTTSYKAKNGGVHSITASYSGDLHNSVSTSDPVAEKVVIPSTTKVTTSLSPSFVGQPVTFTATVKSSYGTIPDGELVTFYDGTTAMASVALAGGKAAYTTSSLSARMHVIKATYPGDTSFEPSTGSVRQVVQKYSTTTALSSSPNPSNFGQTVTFAATVTPSGPFAVTGKVKFWDGSTSIGSATLSGGVATLKKSTLTIGTHAITAQYLSDAYNDKSTSAVVNQVVQ